MKKGRNKRNNRIEYEKIKSKCESKKTERKETERIEEKTQKGRKKE